MNTDSSPSPGGGIVRFLLQLPARALVLGIRVYQRTLSPLLPVVTAGACGCRFSPTCSHYAAEAIRTHGALLGTGLAIVRLVKCSPWHPGGIESGSAAPLETALHAPGHLTFSLLP